MQYTDADRTKRCPGLALLFLAIFVWLHVHSDDFSLGRVEAESPFRKVSADRACVCLHPGGVCIVSGVSIVP